MSVSTLRIGVLMPEVLGTYGDAGNALILAERARRRGIDAEVVHVGLTDPVDALSGGERTKLCLAGISVHNPSVILLDEPTNHLDTSGRRRLYDLIRASRATIVVVSHDVALLNLLGTTCELSAKGLKVYGGNYDFYRERKRIEEEALAQQVDSEQTALRLARKRRRRSASVRSGGCVRANGTRTSFRASCAGR